MCEDRPRKCAHGTEVIELSIAHVHMPPATTHASSEAGFRRSRRGQLCIEQHPLRRAEIECKAHARREAASAQRSAIVGSGASRGLQVPRSSAVYAALAAACPDVRRCAAQRGTWLVLAVNEAAPSSARTSLRMVFSGCHNLLRWNAVTSVTDPRRMVEQGHSRTFLCVIAPKHFSRLRL